MVSRSALTVTAGVIWYAGAISVSMRGSFLLAEASTLHASSFPWHWAMFGLGVLVGILKAWLIFSRSALRNLRRIQALKSPAWWNLYPLWFYPLLALMIATGISMSRFATGDYERLCAVIPAYFIVGIGLALGGIPYLSTAKRNRSDKREEREETGQGL